MNVMLSLLVPALVGVDYGWQQKPDGTIAYIVQVDAETFAALQRTGESVESTLPAGVRSRVSDFSLRVGRDPLPNHNTLPPEDSAVPKSAPSVTVKFAPTPDAISAEAVQPIITPVRTTANYPPAGDIPGASTAPPGSIVTAPQPTQYNWGGAPPSVSIPQTAAPPGTQSWSQNTVPASSATVQPAMSTSGFPINPTAPPNPFPTNSMNSTTAGGAYPMNTAPPSLNNGPRIAQPQPWQTPPREVTISARTPLEPNPPLTNASNGAAGPNLNPAVMPTSGGYPTGAAPQPGYGPPAYPTNNQYYPTQGAPGMPTGAQPPPQYATNNYTPTGGAPVQNYQPQQGNPAPNQNDPYFAQRNQPQPQQREPASASTIHTVGAQPTTNTAAKDDDDWGVRMALLLIGFLTSLACNFYFGWNHYQLRERCRMLLSDRGAF